jgi:hypothetical protein
MKRACVANFFRSQRAVKVTVSTRCVPVLRTIPIVKSTCEPRLARASNFSIAAGAACEHLPSFSADLRRYFGQPTRTSL